MLKLCLSIALLGLVSQINGANVPVFMWGQETPSFLPALSHLRSEEFSTLVNSQQQEDALTLVFVENNLSTEDLSNCKLNSLTCFENLKKISEKSYLPNVENPVEALKTSESRQKSILLSNDGELSENIHPSAGRVFFIYMDDIESDEDYVVHDELINKIYNGVAEKYKNVLAIYTSRHPSFTYSKHSRKTRDIKEGEESKQVSELPVQKIMSDTEEKNILLAFNGLKIREAGADDKVIDIETIVLTINKTGTGMLGIDLKAEGVNIGMMIELSAGSWEVKRVTLNDARLHPEHRIMAVELASFGCLQLKLQNTKTSVIFENIQMQPNFIESTEKFTKFGDAWQCIGYFSPGIWGGLFIAFLFLSILSTGLTWIMDIHTMDRFDDPKGKTIIINAAE